MPTTPILSLPYPASTDSADVPRDVRALAEKLDPLGMVPVGAMMLWPGVSAPPGVNAAGKALWLLMRGQTVPAADYPALATLLGQAGGNITIPDMQDRFPVGAGTTALGTTGGAASVTLTDQQSAMPSHNHGALTGGRDRSLAHAHSLHTSGNLYQPGSNGYSGLMQANSGTYVGDTNAAEVPDHFHTIASEGRVNAAAAHENRPPFRAVNFIIRAG